MLAGEIVQARDAAVQFVESGGIQVEVGADLLQQRQRFIELDRRGIEHRVDFAQARLMLDLAGQLTANLLQLPRQGRAFIAT
jgi:hypothetical protein